METSFWDIFGYCIIGILGMVFLLGAYHNMKEKEKEEEERRIKQEASLDDETLYDPESGLTFTLEEAENIDLPFDSNRIIPDEELEKFYSVPDQEVEKIRRHFILNKFPFENAEPFLNIVNRTDYIKRYDDFELYLTQNPKGLHFGLINLLSVNLQKGMPSTETWEFRIIMINDSRKSKFNEHGITEPQHYAGEHISHYDIIFSKRQATLKEAKELLDNLV